MIYTLSILFIQFVIVYLLWNLLQEVDYIIDILEGEDSEDN